MICKYPQILLIQLTREKRWSEYNIPHPALAVDLCVEAARDVAWDTAGQSVQDDSCWVDGTMAVHIERSQQCHYDDRCSNEESVCHYQGFGYFVCDTVLQFNRLCMCVLLCTAEWMLTCGKGKELSPHSQNGTQQAFVRGEPEDFSVDDLPAVVSLVHIIAATLLLHIVPVGDGWMDGCYNVSDKEKDCKKSLHNMYRLLHGTLINKGVLP